ncbi:MAG: FtsX-like permease family protein [Chloroherpetonaceae bacterium]|nr:FtsX-like permease family protein [Chloroherpetonaceae bacterium]MDW8438045.1 FtsX-like permease family protein [Chloroherpetonaceae bacterium]
MHLLKIFWQVNLRHAVQDWGKFLSSVFAVAVGVAVFLAIRLSNHSAFKAFEATIDNVNGKANAQIQSASGSEFSQSVYRRVLELKERSRAIQAATPVTEQLAEIQGIKEALIVLGIDVFSDQKFRSYHDVEGLDGETLLRFLLQPNAILLSEAFAKRNGVAKHQTLKLVANGLERDLKVIGIFKTDSPANEVANSFAAMDIEQMQRFFGKEGKLDKIDLIIEESRREETMRFLAEALPKDVEVVSAKNRGAQVAKMISAFDLNLSALAFISLLVAMFLIYNAIMTNAIRRRREIGILRALGLSASEIFFLFLLEAFTIGALGSAIGLGLGIALAKQTVESVAQTITALYVYVAATDVRIEPSLLSLAFVVGVSASTLSAIYPAFEVYRVHPRETFHAQTFEQRFSLNAKRIFAASLSLLALGIFFAQLPAVNGAPIFGYASAICVIAGFAFLSPQIIVSFRNLFERVAWRFFGVEGKLANDSLAESLNRTATAVSALMVAIAMLIGIGVMVGSFRQTVAYWIEQTLKADIFIAPAERFAVGSKLPVAREVYDYLRSLPEAESVEGFSSRPISFRGSTTILCASDIDAVLRSSFLLFKEGEFKSAMRRLIEDESAVAVTEVFSNKFGLKMGDRFSLPTPSGEKTFTIAGVYYDYASDRGLILTHRAHFEKIWNDDKLNNLAVFLKDKRAAEPLVKRLREKFQGVAKIVVYSNHGLRQNVMSIFDQTFAITYVLQFVAMAVAAMGVASALMAIAFERRREIGVLRAVGASAEQVRNVTLLEAFLMGVIASILGVACGVCLSLILIYVINLQSFGWTIQIHLPYATIGGAIALVVLTALVSGWIPARYAMRLAIAEQVRFE